MTSISENLLICAAFEFDGCGWLDAHWEQMVATLVPGLAGDIRHRCRDSAGFAARLDQPAVAAIPKIHDQKPEHDEWGVQTLLSGRLFYRDALAKDLGLEPVLDDSALYAAAFNKWGDRCDTRICGAYAVVQRFTQKGDVRLVRSPLQAPPLHFWKDDQRIVTASLPQAIFAAGVGAKVDADYLIDATLRNFANRSRSYFADLSRVASGTSVLIDRESVRTTRFWSPEQIEKIKTRDELEVLEEAERLMREAVTVSLSGARRPAISLSGGLDSQTVASFSLDQLGKRDHLRSYTAVPVAHWLPKEDSRLNYDESSHVAQLAEHDPRLKPTFVSAQTNRFGAYSRDLMRLGYWPTANEMNMHWVHAIHRQAYEDGCDVMLHAELGDSSISYDALTAFPEWLASGRLLKLLRELRKVDDRRSLARRSVALAMMPLLPVTLRRMIDRVRGNTHHQLERWSPLRMNHPQVRAALRRAEASGYDPGFYPGTSSISARSAMILAPLADGPELDLALRLLHGVSRRDPTAYLPLWEYCARLPDDLFRRDGQGRRLARQLLAGRVPKEIAAQTRVGIQSADFRGRLERDAPDLLTEVAELGGESGLVQVIDLDRIEQILRSCVDPHGNGEKDWLKLTSVVPRGIALARFIRHVERYAK